MTTVFHDLIPVSLRKSWTAEGRYPGKPLFTLFEENAARHPDAPAVLDSTGTVTYAELRRTALGLARAFADAGVEPGDVVAVNLANGHLACAVDLAVAALGAICLPYPVGRRRQDTLAMLRRSGATTAVVTRQVGATDYGGLLRELAPELPGLREIFVLGEPLEGTRSLDALLADPPEPLERPAEPDPDSAARILVSSGSEAEPKMVAYSHNALVGGRGEFVRSLTRGDGPPRIMFLVPLASSFGSTGTSVTIAVLGGTLVLMPRFDAAEAVRLIGEHRPTHLMGVPTMFQEMLADPRLAPDAADRVDTSSLTALVCGGAGVDPETVAECVRVFGCAFVNLYGSADGVNCHTQIEDDLVTVQTTAGRPNPRVTTIRIAGDDGRELPRGEVGEIWSRGPMSPLCYVNAPELDARYRTEDGWVRTGDLGRIDDGGRLVIVGRKKEIIIRAGLNISPAEVESLVNTHPAVRHAACLGVPDRKLGERVCVWVVPVPGRSAPDLEELRRHLYEERGLERAKLPELLKVVDELPVNPAGKVDRQALRASVVLSDGPESGAAR
ncbi:class I adenylate-forming enzyme family protein [Streptomyces sp. TRM 70361]|uniref:class I adenylate-forming enzyme family protein n=1 Tax=Streptomyces sp. TRM 70361 TaxID=3116553 RepID=UPI002E7C3B6B|nr:class I adenylate-forming enzyme family protein [Streptomyces sp. TRM 70361]MEE1938042.1 class I adenylate-forming enzyme family protein [Streptomyces sp. TRM 70361]